MALKKYIGARYTPKFMGAWDAQTVYAALSVVYANEQSYVSRKTVPAGTELTNTEYWIKSADWNAQVAEYNRNVENYNKNVEQYNKNVESYEQAVSTFYADTLHSYDVKADMVADQDLKLGDTLLTCGETTIGDGGGSFYQVVAETSAKAVALENGLYALPFEFQPYDYSKFQTEVDNYKKETDAQVAEIKRVSLHTYDNEAAMKADLSVKKDTTLLTTGKATVGDNLGSFWRTQETSDRADAVTLDNGMKAVPFQLNATTLGGSALTFAGKSEAAGVWNVIAPATITIPLTVPQGGTQMTYLGVLYGANQATVTANVVVNGQSKTLTFSDKGEDNQDKFVVYAITVKYTDVVYWGSSTAASWLTRYQFDTVTFSTKLGANAPAPWNLRSFAATTDLNSMMFKVTQKLTLNTFVFNNNYSNIPSIKLELYKDDKVIKTLYDTSNSLGLKTFNINTELQTNAQYKLSLSHTVALSDSYDHRWEVDTNNRVVNGTYDLIIVNNDDSINRRFNGVLDYTIKQ